MTLDLCNDGSLLPALPLEDRKANLCEKLCRIHGNGYRRTEKSGDHLYIPCPICRVNYGNAHERARKHLAFNLDLYFNPARFAMKSRNNPVKSRGYCKCMKCDHVFTAESLMQYPVQQDAGFVVGSVLKQAADRYLVEDRNGNMVPDGPGKTIPLAALSKDHPAWVYLLHRKFDPVLVATQFDADWCEEEAPEGEQYGRRFYRSHAGGFKSTPQGRIIFNAVTLGVRNCWQARYLEISDEARRLKWVWHPYHRQWVTEPDWSQSRSGTPPIKYMTAPGGLRNTSLAGYDYVTNRARHSGDRWCVITEGPLDAARCPEHGMAVLGKSLSETQAVLISRFFNKVILGFDTDKAGREACRSAEATLAHYNVRTCRFFPGDGTGEKKDLGELSYDEVRARVQNLARQL